MRIGFLLGIILILLAVGLGFFSWWNWADQPYSHTGNNQTILVSQGMTPDQLAGELQQHKLIRSALLFKLLAHEQPGFELYAGEYRLSSSMTPQEIIKQLTKKPLVLRVTIPEGYTTEQIIALFVQKGIGTKAEFTKVITEDSFPYSFLKGAPQGIHRLEGFLSPNTYFINPLESPYDIINMLLSQFAKGVTPAVQKRLAAMKLTVPQWVTLASIVEKEAEKASDRPLIASVFLNRLKINKPLQSCATIQFLLGTPKPKLYDKDLQIPSPYNTYLHKGLPPGPISNPGTASLQAVLYPAKTDYLYFVAKKDGYHAFAKTYAQHLRNIKLYE
jgi:UPF0755 protein